MIPRKSIKIYTKSQLNLRSLSKRSLNISNRPIWEKLFKSKAQKAMFACFLLCIFVLIGFLLPSGQFTLGRAYAQDKGEIFVFGPYVPLSPGKYEITFTLRAANNKTSQPVAFIELVTQNGQKSFAFQTIKGTDFGSPRKYQAFSLQLDTTQGAKDFEFRIKYLGGSRMWAEKIGITRLERYSKGEAAGAELIKGATTSRVVNEEESFLKTLRHRELKIDDPILSRRIGYLVFDSKASTGQAWLVEPWMVKTSSAEPWKISPPWTKQPRRIWLQQIKAEPFLFLSLGFITGCIFALMGIFIYRRVKPREGDSKSLINRATIQYFSKRHAVVLMLLTGIVLSLFLGDVSVLGISTLGGYLLVLYLILSLVRKMDSRIPIAVALLFLASCPFFLIAGQKELAERAAIYAYSFLIIGVVFQFKEYIAETRQKKKPKGKAEEPG